MKICDVCKKRPGQNDGFHSFDIAYMNKGQTNLEALILSSFAPEGHSSVDYCTPCSNSVRRISNDVLIANAEKLASKARELLKLDALKS